MRMLQTAQRLLADESDSIDMGKHTVFVPRHLYHAGMSIEQDVQLQPWMTLSVLPLELLHLRQLRQDLLLLCILLLV